MRCNDCNCWRLLCNTDWPVNPFWPSSRKVTPVHMLSILENKNVITWINQEIRSSTTETAREPVRYVRKFMFYNRQLRGKWPWTSKNLASAKAEMISTSRSSFFSKTCWYFMRALYLEYSRMCNSFPFLFFLSSQFFFFFSFRLFVFFFLKYEIIVTSNQIDCITPE